MSRSSTCGLSVVCDVEVLRIINIDESCLLPSVSSFCNALDKAWLKEIGSLDVALGKSQYNVLYFKKCPSNSLSDLLSHANSCRKATRCLFFGRVLRRAVSSAINPKAMISITLTGKFSVKN